MATAARDAAGRARDHRPADPELHGLRRRRGAGRCSAPGAAGRAADRRPRRREGLPQAARADGGEVHRQPVRVRRRATRSSTAPATRSASTRPATSLSTAASTTRSRSAASGSSSARSRRASQVLPGIDQAAVVLRQDDGRRPARRLPGARARRASSTRRALRQTLRRADCRPTWCRTISRAVDELPRLTSGKVDRKALRSAAARRSADAAGEQEPPRNETEAALLAAAKRVFGNQAIPFEARLLHRSRRPFAARRPLRRRRARGAGARRASRCRTSTASAPCGRSRTTLIARTGGVGTETAIRDLSFAPPPLLRRFLCGLAQAAALPFVIALADRAMARHLRHLPAAHRRRARLLRRDRRAAAASTSASTSSRPPSRSRPSG